MKLMTIVAASLLLVAGAAQAQSARSAESTYAEIGYTHIDLRGHGDSATPGALRGIFGYELHPNAALEGMLAFGVSKGGHSGVVNSVYGTPLYRVPGNLKLQDAVGVYLKPKFNVHDSFELFGRLGYTRAKFQEYANAGYYTTSDSFSSSGVSYGAGANYKYSPNAYIGVDYMRYSKKDGSTFDGVTASVGYRF